MLRYPLGYGDFDPQIATQDIEDKDMIFFVGVNNIPDDFMFWMTFLAIGTYGRTKGFESFGTY